MKLYSVFIYYKWKSPTFRKGAAQHYSLRRYALARSELQAVELVVDEALWLDRGIIDAYASVEDFGNLPQMIDTTMSRPERINAETFDALPARFLSEGEAAWGTVFRFSGDGLIPATYLTSSQQGEYPEGFQLKVRQ